MAVSSLSSLPNAPDRQAGAGTFSNDVDGFLSSMVTLQLELNVSIGEFNVDFSSIAGSVSAASTSASNAATSESNASTSADNASTSESNASTSAGNASTSAGNASTSETNAGNSATSSQNWATTTGAIVDATDYSSKEWAMGVFVPDGSSKQWATEDEDTVVSGGEFSAKHYAAKAQAAVAPSYVRYDSVTFEGTVSDGDAVYWNNTNSRWEKAVADGTEAQNMGGFADVTNSRVYGFGEVSGLLSGLTPDTVYYLHASTAGTITTTAGSVRVGYAKTATTIFADVDTATDIALEVNNAANVVPAAGDKLGIVDVSDSNGLKNITITQLFTNPLLTSPKEKATVSATAATGTVNFDALTQGVLYYTTNASANWTLNIRGDGSNSLDSQMSVGDAWTVVFLVTQGGTAYYQTGFEVDGSSVTPDWVNGDSPAAGNASGIDVYTFTIIKTASSTFKVLGDVRGYT